MQQKEKQKTKNTGQNLETFATYVHTEISIQEKNSYQ